MSLLKEPDFGTPAKEGPSTVSVSVLSAWSPVFSSVAMPVGTVISDAVPEKVVLDGGTSFDLTRMDPTRFG